MEHKSDGTERKIVEYFLGRSELVPEKWAVGQCYYYPNVYRPVNNKTNIINFEFKIIIRNWQKLSLMSSGDFLTGSSWTISSK